MRGPFATSVPIADRLKIKGRERDRASTVSPSVRIVSSPKPIRAARVRAQMKAPNRAAFAVAGVLLLAACGKEAVRDPSSTTIPAQPPAEVVVADPIARPTPFEPASAPPLDVPPADSTQEPLPPAWTGPAIPKLGFADAMTRARAARDSFTRLGPPPQPTGAPDAAAEDPRKGWFTKAYAAVDRASRMYAAAFHAADASREGRIDAIAEAAELDLAMSQKLDDVGLGAMPIAWRSDPSIASTFEDVAVGPTRRWREEARALAKQCVETARSIGVATESARKCVTLPTGARAKLAKKGAPDGGTPCACDPGDPLCSASLGGWCGP